MVQTGASSGRAVRSQPEESADVTDFEFGYREVDSVSSYAVTGIPTFGRQVV